VAVTVWAIRHVVYNSLFSETKLSPVTNPSGRIMARGSTQPLAEMSTSGISSEAKASGA
jgi:hypothetical protein